MLLGLLGLWALVFPEVLDFDVDDTYITLRYGRNLARGFGPVFNPGEWVEGATSPLWILAAAGLEGIAPDPLRAIKVLSALFGFGVLGGTSWIASGLGASPWLPGVALALVASHAGFWAWSSSGMEASAFAFFSLVLARSGFAPGSLSASVTTGLWAGLLVWIRPEALLVAPLFVLSLGHRSWRERGVSLGIVGLSFLALFGLRFGLYGELLPNTYYAKVTPGLETLFFGGSYLFEFLRGFGFGLVPLLGVLGTRLEREESPERARRVQVLRNLLALNLLAVGLEGGDLFPLDRFLLPAIPLLALLATRAMARAWPRRGPPRGVLLAVLVLVFFASFSGARMEEALALEGTTEIYCQIGVSLRESFPPETTYAASGVGAIPYLTDFPTLDTVGLCDAHIARSPPDPTVLRFHQRGDPDYVLARRPEILLPGLLPVSEGFPLEKLRRVPYARLVPRELAFPTMRGIWQRPEFLSGWRPLALEVPAGRFVYFLRRDLPGPGSESDPASGSGGSP